MNIEPGIRGLGVRMSGSFHHAGRLLFEGLTMELAAEKWTCLLGPSGVGKSTVLRLLAGLSTGGEFSGKIVAEDGRGVAHRISYMAQSDLLFPWLNVRQNVMLGQRLRGEHSTERCAGEMIQQVGLGGHINKRPAQLSGGMRQRVALARTLMEDTPLVLLDEPFSALDARTRSEMQELAFGVLKGKTVLFVTHDPAEAVRLSHHLYLMSAQGLTEHTLELSEPIREVDDTRVLTAQAELLVSLKSGISL
jgi:putative hydroxymethylpyrimidine transport system ATP-binding protein